MYRDSLPGLAWLFHIQEGASMHRNRSEPSVLADQHGGLRLSLLVRQTLQASAADQ